MDYGILPDPFTVCMQFAYHLYSVYYIFFLHYLTMNFAAKFRISKRVTSGELNRQNYYKMEESETKARMEGRYGLLRSHLESARISTLSILDEEDEEAQRQQRERVLIRRNGNAVNCLNIDQENSSSSSSSSTPLLVVRQQQGTGMNLTMALEAELNLRTNNNNKKTRNDDT